LEAKTNYTIVGLAVVILAGTLIAASLWLSVGFEQKKYNTYAVYMREAVGGLAEQSPVKFNGVKVGFVKKIELNQRDPRQVEILLSIEEGTPVTVSTTATLISQGITGTTYVGLAASTSDLTPMKAPPNKPYPVIPSKPSIFNQLDKVLKEVSENVGKVSEKLDQVLTDENISNFNKSLSNIKIFTNALADNGDTVISDLRSSLKKFETMAASLSGAGKSVSVAMGSGKTAIDKISQQAIPPVTTLIHRLNTIAGNLEKLSAQLRQNPSIVIRGSTPPPPGPGE
jgi:phospholipid/cholesterol/gamma-HCH transport system substrate-binding protein